MIADNVAVDVQHVDELDPEAVTAAGRPSDQVNAAPVPQDSASATFAAATPADDAVEPKPPIPTPVTRRDFERALRTHLGFSKRQAAAIAASGFAARGAEEDHAEEEQLSALTDALKRLSGPN